MPIIQKPFAIKKMNTVEEMVEEMRARNLDFPVSKNLSVLSRPIVLSNTRRLPNSLAINPLEGTDANLDGSPSELTFRRYEQFAAGGAGIIWFEATAFMADGRGGPQRLYINKESERAFRTLTNKVDKVCLDHNGYKPYKVLQLTHAGRTACDNEGNPKPLTIFKNPHLDPYYPGVEVVSDEYIDNMEHELVEAAKLAYQAGFDAVEVKMCHDFLMRELLAAYTREGKYGGSYENRTRFLFRAIEHIKANVGNRMDIVVRLNAYDALPYPYGWGMIQKDGMMYEDSTEAIRLVRDLVAKGVRIINISCMEPRFSPRSDEGYEANFKSSATVVPYEGLAVLMETTRRIKRLVPEAVIISSGLSWFEQFSPYVAAGGVEEGWFDIAGFGRQALADPGFFTSLLQGQMPDRSRACCACDSCMRVLLMGWPAGCVVHDPLYTTIFTKALEEKAAKELVDKSMK